MQAFTKTSALALQDDVVADTILRELPAGTRRRLSPYAKLLVRVVYQLIADYPQVANTPIVLATQHGDLHRTIRLLHDLADEQQLSPTQFSLSVNNAALGQLSILLDNTAAMTTVAAGDDSFAMGWLEALLQLQQHSEVVFIYADEPPPEPYTGHAALPEHAFAMAVLLSNQQGHPLQFEAKPSTEKTGLLAPVQQLHQLISQHGQGEVQLQGKQAWSWYVG
ncbi:beta-ketoacyl synthase chain length factor [Pseudidiomarina sp. CB1]|uniref:beta-ketoacyl synthase chain length factor n=1 Tax=Pseudidiomarina sp. CB1 TaxID=2972484 RepID=UPI002162F087|nr:beta-ketoacyl synthase chain length factor [Pseudidiomarina sp. CB1]